MGVGGGGGGRLQEAVEREEDLEHELVVLLLLGDQKVERAQDARLRHLRRQLLGAGELPDDHDHLEQHVVLGEARHEVALQKVDQVIPGAPARSGRGSRWRGWGGKQRA